MKLIVAFVLAGHLIYSFAHAHGEDKLGPNGGFIRMPGAYHTEIVPAGKNEFRVFLLDIEWKNPSVKDSVLSVTYSGGKAKSEAKCLSREGLYYLCSFPSGVDLTAKGDLLVESRREGQNGIPVKYPLPLRIMKMDDGHAGH